VIFFFFLDPTDDNIKFAIKATKLKYIIKIYYENFLIYNKFYSIEFDDTHLEYYCEFCNFYVGSDTKHCKRCDRCVNGFDHQYIINILYIK
jgi:hypothetical protein